MSSVSPPPRAMVDPDEPGESVASVPWESVRLDSPGTDRKVWYAVAAVVVAAAIAWSVVGRMTPGVVPTPTSSPPVSSSTVSSTSTTVPVIVTEADLKAVDPIRVERRVMAYAEVAAAEFFSADAGGVWAGVTFDVVQATYVERVHAVEVDQLESGIMRVLVAVSVLDGTGEGAFQRRPLRGVAVDVDPSTDPLQVVGLPTPVEVPFGRYRVPETSSTAIDPRLADAVRAWEPPFGAVDIGSVSSAGPGSDRVMLIVVDEAGNRWPMSVTITDGRLAG